MAQSAITQLVADSRQRAEVENSNFEFRIAKLK